MVKKNILIFVSGYKPGYKSGGPVQSIYNLVSHLNDKANFKILCRNSDIPSDPPYKNVLYNTWVKTFNSTIMYLTRFKANILSFHNLIKKNKHDYIYFNSFFDYKFSIAPLLAIRLFFIKDSKMILAPRGEFSDGAIQIKTIKKKTFILISKFLGLHKGIKWHASTKHEKLDIIKALNVPEKDIHIASDIGLCPNKSIIKEYKGLFKESKTKIIFLSRITKKKNLLFAIEIIKRIKFPIVFDIYGNIDDENYWNKCKVAMSNLPENIIINYKGSITHDKVVVTLQNYHLHILTTFGENFGHSIYESFCAGTPVIISDQTPWNNLKEKGIGWDLPLNSIELYIKVINTFIKKSNEEKISQRKRVFDYAVEKSKNHQDLIDNYSLFDIK